MSDPPPVGGAAMLRLVFFLALAFSAGCRARADRGTADAPYRPPDLTTQVVNRFDATVYGASGVAQLDDGRIVVAEDEERHPFDVVDLFGGGTVRTFNAHELARSVAPAGAKGLNDLEALTRDTKGHLYASTSHSLNAKGESKPERELLVRFDVSGDQITDVRLFGRLKDFLAKLDPRFIMAGESLPDEKRGLNIEGLAWDPKSDRLLIGFRNPRHEHKALLVWLENPGAVFERNAEPALAGPVALDLDGEGVRDVTFSPTLGGFLILAGAWRHEQHTSPTLWLWGGAADSAPVELRTSALHDLKPEGIAEVTAGGRRGLLIVSDDGTADDAYDRGRSLVNHGVSSRYAVIPFSRLRSENPSLPAVSPEP